MSNDYYESHRGEWQWQDGEYTVTRTTAWSGPGCHDGCGVLYYTKDGKLEKVEGDPDNPFNQGALCMRCLEMPEAAKLGAVSACYAIEQLGTQEHHFSKDEFRKRYEASFGPLPITL